MVDAYEAVLNCNEAPYKPTLIGPDQGTTGKSYDYTVNVEDPEGDDVLIWLDWGDGTNTGWQGPYASGEDVIMSHEWEDPDEYIIFAKAMDEYYESDWSDPIVLTIDPLIKIEKILGGFFKAKAVIKNNGDETASCVKWTISLDGGAIIGSNSEGEVDIPAGEEVTVESGLILGFGRTEITVTAEYPICSDEKDNGGFIYIFYVHVNFGGE